MFENLVIEREYACYFVIVFFLKRHALALSILFLGSVSQISINLILSMLSLCYIIYVCPMNSKLLNSLEFMNELTFLTSIYICYQFTDVAIDQNHKRNYGFFIICLTSLNITANVAPYLFTVIPKLLSFIKKTRKFNEDATSSKVVQI